MQKRKIPMRKCMGCNEMFPKKELVRVVKTRLPGEEGEEEKYEISLKNARKAKRLERVLECSIPEEVYDRMEREMTENE